MAQKYAKAFYDSKEWDKVRQYVLMRDRYKCVICGRPAQEVHHVEHLTPSNIWDVNISLNPANLKSLCRDCHFEQHELDRKRAHHKPDCAEGYEFDENGMLVPTKV